MKAIIETFGHCINDKCDSYDVMLADGLCMRCWDAGWKPPDSSKSRSKKTVSKKTVLSESQ
jgi:hypothetical protein